MRLNRHDAEIVEPSFGSINAIGDVEAVARHWQVAHKEARRGIIRSGDCVTKDDGVLWIADTHHTLAQIIVESDP